MHVTEDGCMKERNNRRKHEGERLRRLTAINPQLRVFTGLIYMMGNNREKMSTRETRTDIYLLPSIV